MKKISVLLGLMIVSFSLMAQQFEASKADLEEFNGLKVKVGGDFALQFQSLDHSSQVDTLYDLVSDLNLPTANLNLNVLMADGVKLHLRTYLSSRHHNEAWVKGGHLTIDKLDFISKGFLAGIMDYTTIKVGLDEINYGDAHFRRSDNARTITNPFVGNYIMDAFATEAFGEVTVQKSGIIGVLGLSNGKMNQSVTVTSRNNGDNKISFYGKLGYDDQLSDDLRVRLTGSWYMNNGTTTGSNLYGGDRTGARYYSVLVKDGADDVFTSGRYNPRFKQMSSYQINSFIKFKGLEFFGLYEMVNGGDADSQGVFTQLGTELLYRFGADEKFYLGGRYNKVSGKTKDTAKNSEISRINVGGGWFLTENIITKVEYVSQEYSGDGWIGGTYQGAKFNGIVVEAAISF